MKKIFCTFFSTLIVIPALAEPITVSGTILDEMGEPLPGANISASSTPNTGTTSDINGNFTITNFPSEDDLKISFVGFKTETLSPGQNLRVTLKEESFKINDVTVVATWESKPCSTDQLTAINAKSGMTARNPDGNGVYCVPDACVFGYKLNKKAEKCEKIECVGPRYVLNEDGDDCKDMVGERCTLNDPHEKEAKYKWENNQLICEIKKCNDHYIPNDDGSACIPSDGPCSAEQLAKIEHATAGELKNGICHATECEAGYEVNKGICIAISGDCKPMPKNAIAAHREYNAEAGKEICIIDQCKDGYTPSQDKLSCITPILSEEDAKKEIEELQENADEMKAKEQSTANKLLGAASIGAMGIGGMQALSALSEQRADTAAEQDMAAYLATFRCDYGQGKNIQGGETGIELPGGNQLFSLYNEYVQLAADLKIRKEALGLTPGIESETILDKAETGLYDDVGLGKTNGAYTSLAAALSDPNSAAAAAWAEQKADTAQKLETGLITAGIGAAVGIAGNLAINENRKAAQESSDDIKAKYAPLKSLENNVKALPDQEANAKCPEDATGFYPDCDCNVPKKSYNNNTNTCENCPGDKIGDGSKCVCPDGTVPGDNDTCQKITTNITPKCDATDPNIKVDPNTGECTCVNGYIKTADGQNCECPSTSHEINNGLCIKKSEPVVAPTPVTQTVVPEKTVLPAKNLFALGSYELTNQAMLTIGEFAGSVKTQMGTDTNYCITVVGHTDETGTNAINEPLSQNRANAVKKALTSAGLSEANLKTYGLASTECTSEFRKNAEGCTADNKNCEACRKVEISFSTTSCSNS